MTPLPLFLALLFLPPEADRHSREAIAHHQAGRLEAAEAELVAAYASMPDPVRDRVDREHVLGSLRGVLLDIHQKTGSPAPLCRLQAVLRAHLEAFPATAAQTPEPEVTGNRARLAEVTGQLTAFPADACAPMPAPPPPQSNTAPPAPQRAVVDTPPAGPPTPPLNGPTPRQLRIAGGVAFGLGGALLVATTVGLVTGQRHLQASRALDADNPGRLFSADERASLEDHLRGAHAARALTVGAGISSAIFTVGAVALITTARFKANKTRCHQNSVLLAPWRVPGGAGLTLRWALP